VPEAAAGGRVRVVQRQREALGGFRRTLPLQRWRTILAGAVVAIELMHQLQPILILEFRRCHCEVTHGEVTHAIGSVRIFV
jgi:hypothetical protein